ncbi:MAG: helix-turn-helix domain-containing protein [Chloroflexota bacterium]|nr:helix-turn-helix domain-containing protein [Chloroflexota bacterium]
MSTPALTAFQFDTDDHPAQTRYEMWREVMAATHQVAPTEATPAPFHIQVAVWRLGQMVVTSGQFTSQSFARSSENIRRDHIDHFGLFAQGSGTRHCFVGSDTELLRENDIQIVDFAQVESSRATAGNSGTLYLPRDLVEEVIPNFSRFHGRVLRDSMAALFARHVLSMGYHLPHLPVTALPHLTQATMEMAFACLQSLESGSWEMNSAVVEAMRHRVERYIESQLEEPNISPASVAQACDMSRTTLYRLFEPHGGVMTYVKRRRLHRIRSILVANEDLRSLASISEDYGFESGAHFSREFRKEFGYSPGEARGNRLPHIDATAPSGADLGVILRSLHP